MDRQLHAISRGKHLPRPCLFSNLIPGTPTISGTNLEFDIRLLRWTRFRCPRLALVPAGQRSRMSDFDGPGRWQAASRRLERMSWRIGDQETKWHRKPKVQCCLHSASRQTTVLVAVVTYDSGSAGYHSIAHKRFVPKHPLCSEQSNTKLPHTPRKPRTVPELTLDTPLISSVVLILDEPQMPLVPVQTHESRNQQLVSLLIKRSGGGGSSSVALKVSGRVVDEECVPDWLVDCAVENVCYYLAL